MRFMIIDTCEMIDFTGGRNINKTLIFKTLIFYIIKCVNIIFHEFKIIIAENHIDVSGIVLQLCRRTL